MTCGEALVQQLLRYGIDRFSAFPEFKPTPCSTPLWEKRDRTSVIQTRREVATAYAAHGFARSSRVLYLTGQIHFDRIGYGRGALHGINDQLETTSSVVMHAKRALSPESIPGVVQRVWGALRAGRQPVPEGDLVERRRWLSLQRPGSLQDGAAPDSGGCGGVRRSRQRKRPSHRRAAHGRSHNRVGAAESRLGQAGRVLRSGGPPSRGSGNLAPGSPRGAPERRAGADRGSDAR